MMGPISSQSSLAVMMLVVSGTLAAPRIVNTADTVAVNEDSSAVLRCRTQDLGSQKVTWSFISHDFVIYDGLVLKTSHPTKYTLLNAQDGSIHDLQILEVDLSDQGFYKCSVGSDEIIWKLDVIEMPELPTSTSDNINVTDCCISKGMSQNCLPACYPPAIDLAVFDAVAMCGDEADVGILTSCLTAGSNHDTCCLYRGVDLACLGLCHNSPPAAVPGVEVCYSDEQINLMISCVVQGADLFPSAPTSVTALAVSGKSPSILVSWAPPEKNAWAVTGYKIMYRSDTETTHSSVVTSDSSQHSYRLTQANEDIMFNKGYFIHLVALADHGISLGSIEIEVYVRDGSLHENISKSVSDCCERRRVEVSCRSSLCQSKIWSEFNTFNTLDCFPYLDDTFTCLVGERNHTQCCMAYGVTSDCWSLCSGNPPNFDSSLIGCVAQMGVIEACVQEGFSTQPAPPKNLRVEHVTNNLAQIAFDPSDSDNIVHYLVQVRARSLSEEFAEYQTLVPTKTVFELTQLAENTHYWVRVVSETAEEGSLPSETVLFLTYSDSYAEPEEVPGEQLLHNLTECCMDTGMPENCWRGCVYRADMTSYYSNHLQECIGYIGSVLACASDGRDHRECCHRREIQSPCEELCVHTKQGPLDSKYVPVCVPETSKAVLCYIEGLVDLPRYPENLMISGRTSRTISLVWEHPSTGSAVEFYHISYWLAKEQPDQAIEMSTNRTSYIIQDLLPGTEYSINVFSINENGTSAPSPTITQYTLQEDSAVPSINKSEIPVPNGRAFWQNITDCCQQTVSSTCQQVCLNQETTRVRSDDCFPESIKMLACYADGNDHSLCCEQGGLPTECIPVCGGNAGAVGLHQATCMSYTHRNIILSCFLERQGLVPDAPKGFTVEQSVYADLNVSLSWDAPAYCTSDCQFTVFYWDEALPDAKMEVMTTSTSTSVEVAEAEKRYTFMVVAHNSYGSGPPSAKETLPITIYERDVKVYLYGEEPAITVGGDATLICSVAGFPLDIKDMDVHWLFNKRRVVGSGKRYLSIGNVDPNVHQGLYTCEVTDHFTTSSASFYLSVIAKPRYDQLRAETDLPGLGLQGKVACWFWGFPDSDKNAWLKDGQPLEQDLTKYSIGLDRRFHTGITSYRVKIANLEESDYGDYSIKVSNQFGSAQCHVRLSHPKDIDDITVAPAQPNPKACCARAGVPELCQELCGFHVNVVEILQDSRYITCLRYFDTFITCGADGRDHTKCCQESAVLPYCQPMCRGVIPGSVTAEQDKLLQCLADWEPIISCMEKGAAFIPMHPTNLVLSVKDDGRTLVVGWSQPRVQPDHVDHYIIHYTNLQTNITQQVAVNALVLQHDIKGVEPMTRYSVRVSSGNKRGNSLPSPAKEIDTFTFKRNRPYNLETIPVAGTSDVRLTWAMRRAQFYNSFTVNYKEKDESYFKKIHNVKEPRYTLTGLKAGTTYQWFVVGEMSFTSPKSSTQEFTTQGTAQTEEQKSGPSSNKIAIGVGVTVAVIALIAIVLLILYFVFKSRLIAPPVNDAVAFENPSFGSSAQVKMHGIQDTGFGYGQLEEDGGVEATTPQQNVYSNTVGGENNNSSVLAGESSTDPPIYDNPLYQPTPSAGSQAAAGGSTQNSVATLELEQPSG